MATIKFIKRSHQAMTKSNNQSRDYEDYLTKKEALYTGIGLQKDQMIDQIKATQLVHHKFKPEFFVGEVLQNFDPKISTPGSETKFHQIGVEFVKKQYPGFQAAVITHTDKEHYHNHILVNPVHPQTGLRLDEGHFYTLKLRDVSNKLMQKHGLPIPERGKQPFSRLDSTAYKMLRSGRTPVNFDLIKKIDVARSVSRDLDEFKHTLGRFGITTRVTKQTISYKHPSRERGTRGKTLGENYTLATIEKTLKHNESVFRRNPTVLATQFKKLSDIPNPKNIDCSKFEFIKFVDSTGHQRIAAKVESSIAHTKAQEKRRIQSIGRGAIKGEFSKDKLSDSESVELDERSRKQIARDASLTQGRKSKRRDADRGADLDIDIF